MAQRHLEAKAMLMGNRHVLNFTRLTNGVAAFKWPIPDRVQIEGDEVQPIFVGAKIKTYYPAEASTLIPALTKLADQAEASEEGRKAALNEFAVNYGLLRTPPWRPAKPGTVKEHFMFAVGVREVVELIANRDQETVADHINQIRSVPNCGVAVCSMLDPKIGRLVPVLFASDLRGLVTVQLETYANGGDLKTCEWCGQLFLPVRSDQVYCPPVKVDELLGSKPPQTRSRCKQAAKSKRHRDIKRAERDAIELKRTRESYGSDED